jgi:hypothetical protein
MLMSEKQVSDLIIAIIVAVMVAVMVANRLCRKPGHCCKIRFAGLDSYRKKKKKRLHRAIDLEPVRKKKSWKASKATPIRNPPITVHITHLVSAIPPPLLLFPYLSQIFFLTKNCCSIIPYTEVRYDK